MGIRWIVPSDNQQQLQSEVLVDQDQKVSYVPDKTLFSTLSAWAEDVWDRLCVCVCVCVCVRAR